MVANKIQNHCSNNSKFNSNLLSATKAMSHLSHVGRLRYGQEKTSKRLSEKSSTFTGIEVSSPSSVYTIFKTSEDYRSSLNIKVQEKKSQSER